MLSVDLSLSLDFPTGLAFAPTGELFVAQSGLALSGGPSPGGSVLHVGEDGAVATVCAGLRAPVTGLFFHDGNVYVTEAGHPSRIARVSVETGDVETVIDGFPGPGNYHLCCPVVGPDGKLYFSQGAMTNSSIIGHDGYELAWLRKLEHAVDIPGYDLTLTGVNQRTAPPRDSDRPYDSVETGSFMPFGQPATAGATAKAALPCTAGVMRCDLDGSNLELVAWGLRNAFGMRFLADGRLLALDQAADDRGSRPIGNVPDTLYEVREGLWYGWPDYFAGEPVTDKQFVPQRGEPPVPAIANHDQLPPVAQPLAKFPINSAPTKFAVVPDAHATLAGQFLVAMFGDERPMTAPGSGRAGRCILRLDPSTWELHDYAPETPVTRPIDLAFHPHDDSLWILDFGTFEMDMAGGVRAEPSSGRLTRVPAERV